jgi:hypothetical protein
MHVYEAFKSIRISITVGKDNPLWGWGVFGVGIGLGKSYLESNDVHRRRGAIAHELTHAYGGENDGTHDYNAYLNFGPPDCYTTEDGTPTTLPIEQKLNHADTYESYLEEYYIP